MAKPKAKQQRKAATAGSSVDTSVAPSVVSSRPISRDTSPVRPKQKRKPFRFFDLPSELRLRIYEDVLHVRDTVDLHPDNFYYVLPRLTLFLVSHRMHEEAYRVFYSQTIRLFPLHGRFFHTKYPLLQRLPVRYREAVNKMELLLGPGWTKPPRGQQAQPSLGLMDCKNMRTLKIFVQLDPSVDWMVGFRGEGASKDTYQHWCVDMLHAILEQVPSLETVELDGWDSVKRNGPLVSALRGVILHRQKKLVWGLESGWAKEDSEPAIADLAATLTSISLSTAEAPSPIATIARGRRHVCPMSATHPRMGQTA